MAKHRPLARYDRAFRRRALQVLSRDALQRRANKISERGQIGEPSGQRRTSQDSMTNSIDAIARRLGLGRTLAVQFAILNTSLFADRRVESSIDWMSSVGPVPGMSATLDGHSVFIVDWFIRRGQLLADVAPIELTSARSAPAGSTHVVHRRGQEDMSCQCSCWCWLALRGAWTLW